MQHFEHGLSVSASKRQARALAKEREQGLRERDRRQLAQLRAEIRAAKQRRKLALKRAVVSCGRGRQSVKRQIQAYRAAERARINAHVRELKQAARRQCSARKARIRTAGGTLVQRRGAELEAERRLQAQLRRLASDERKRKAKLTTARERRAEDNDAVRSNIPPELVVVFDAVHSSIRGGPRTTRTEAFLEWAASHPDEVIRYQQDDADREVRRLVAEQGRIAKRLRKTKPYKVDPEDVERLAIMGAQRRRPSAAPKSLDWVPF
jgi:hypothetical protein